MMQLYNSATRKKEDFQTHTPGHVEMYTCGPTVYHFAHIGNLRSYIMEDVLEKTLRYTGYDVNRVMNITDVGHLTSDADEGEDKMLKGAKRENKSVMDIAKFYTDAFFSDCEKLNIKTPDVVQPATGLIDDFIHMVEGLIEPQVGLAALVIRGQVDAVQLVTQVRHGYRQVLYRCLLCLLRQAEHQASRCGGACHQLYR